MAIIAGATVGGIVVVGVLVVGVIIALLLLFIYFKSWYSLAVMILTNWSMFMLCYVYLFTISLHKSDCCKVDAKRTTSTTKDIE